MEHIHEVLRIIEASKDGLTEEELKQTVKDKFGENPVFTSCSDNTMSLDEIIPFITERGKVATVNGKLKLANDVHICDD